MNAQVQQIVVDAVSKFGVLDKITGKWFNPAKKEMLSTFKIGNIYEVSLESNKGKDGKTYMNIVSAKVSATVPAPLFDIAAKVVKPSIHPMAMTNGINKDERILVQGLTQALLQSPVMQLVQLDQLPTFVEQNVVKLVEIVKRLSK